MDTLLCRASPAKGALFGTVTRLIFYRRGRSSQRDASTCAAGRCPSPRSARSKRRRPMDLLLKPSCARRRGTLELALDRLGRPIELLDVEVGAC